MSIKRILAFTGIRSDYDLLSDLYIKINNDPEIEFGLIVSGAHLSNTYGYTVKYIESDELPIIARIETLINSDSASSRLKTASILIQNCIHTVESFKPDVLIYAGDREDALAASMIGSYLGIPTIHFFGGDHSVDGNVDNPVRHAISKLSTIHFVTNLEHLKRLKKIGENENRIHLVGNPALDKFVDIPTINKKNLLLKFGRVDWDDYALTIFHPILGYEEKAGLFFEEIIIALKKHRIKSFVSYPNTDAGNNSIIEKIKKYSDDPDFFFYKNIEKTLFVNLMRNAKFMIGNSSAGLLEAPIIPLAVVNVGARQVGRLAANNVLFVEQGISNIEQGIECVMSKEFQSSLKKITSLYGEGDSVEKAFNLIKTLDIKKYLYKKEDPLYE